MDQQAVHPTIETFMALIMRMYATTPGMGSASAGVFGTSAVGAQSVDQLKRATAAFAAAYRKDPGSQDTRQLAGDVEGHLLVLQATHAIPEEHAQAAVDYLHALQH